MIQSDTLSHITCLTSKIIRMNIKYIRQVLLRQNAPELEDK